MNAWGVRGRHPFRTKSDDGKQGPGHLNVGQTVDMNRSRALGTAALVLGTILALTPITDVAGAATKPKGAPNSLTGYGAPVKRFEAEHPPTGKYEGAPFGRVFASPEGPVREFILQSPSLPLMTFYIRSIPENTPAAKALSIARTELPSDSIVTGQFVSNNIVTSGPRPPGYIGPSGQSCEVVDFHSPTLARFVGSNGDMYIELAYEDAHAAPTWRPTNVNTVSYKLGPGLPGTVTC